MYKLITIAVASVVAVISIVVLNFLQVMPYLAPSAKDVEPGISAEFPFEYKSIDVLSSSISYVEAGNPNGPPIVLVHGNPTSAYLWRNVIPHLEGSGRVIAPDLIGMGRSGKPDIAYRFEEHAEYFAEFIKAMGLRDVTLVLHDWGGGVGFDYAARNSENVKGIAFFEAVVKPMSLSEAGFATEYLFGRLRNKEDGHNIIAVNNYFVETMLPMMSGRTLNTEEMAVYRSPYPTVESRKPVAQWPREIPLDGTPADNTKRIGENFEWLKESDMPLFMIYANPGLIWTDATRPALEAELPRMETASIGSGLHYLQEVQPTKIGELLADWIDRISGQ